jgi:hypothetical protein
MTARNPQSLTVSYRSGQLLFLIAKRPGNRGVETLIFLAEVGEGAKEMYHLLTKVVSFQTKFGHPMALTQSAAVGAVDPGE